ncbi:MAG: restriction endonuclease subunit S [Nostoc sp.]
MSKWQKVKIGDLLLRSKIPIDIEDQKEYKRVTIRTKHQGVSLRDKEIGKKIGTKKQFILKSRQFLMSKIDARYGAFGIAGDDVDGAIITGNFWAYDINDSLTTVEWINKYTNSPSFYDLCERASSGITHRRYLNEQTFLNHELFIPAIDEQSRILFLNLQKTQLINNIKNELNNQEKYISQLKQAILQEAIAGQLTAEWRDRNPMQKGDPDTDAAALLAKIKAEKQQAIADGKLKQEKPLLKISPDEIPFSLPDSWVWCRLGEISSIVRGGSPRPAGDKKYYEGNIPFLKVADLTRDETIFLNNFTYTIKEAGLYKTRLVEANTLMLTNSGATLGVPKICTFSTTFNDGIAAFLGLINELDKVFIYYFLKSKTKWFLSEAARGQGQPNLNTDIIGNTLFPLPPLAEQKAIVEKVDYLMKIIDQLEEQIKHRKQLAEDLMQTVLREAFE